MSTELLRAVLEDRPDASIFRVRRDIYSDPTLFELEMKHLFEGGWVYLAHASQLPEVHDYLTTWIGRRPVVLMRDGEGAVRAFLNTCPHRGALICPLDKGNASVHVCSFHSWAFESSGRLRGIKARDVAAYTPEFMRQGHDLIPVARFDEYRGFLFGSLNSDVPSLKEYLGDVTTLLDLVLDQSSQGIEFVPGGSTFTYDGNWKAQLENCSDAYHLTSVHPTYFQIAKRRAAAATADSDVSDLAGRTNAVLESHGEDMIGGSFSFQHGHVLSWTAIAPSPASPLFNSQDDLQRRVGAMRAKWMFYARNLTIFPNLQIAEGFSSQLRVMRPLGPNLTEMSTYCIGPRGEDPGMRRLRLRQYEDFFMPSGMATPDDLALYEDCQLGHIAADDIWLQGHERGLGVVVNGPNREAEELGLKPTASLSGPWRLWDETLFQAYYRAWRERLQGALRGKSHRGTP